MHQTGAGLLRRCGPWCRVAVLRPGRIGDYLCATPAVRALKRAAPGARLDYVGLPLVRDLVTRNPSVDRFVAFPGFPNIAEQFFEPRRAVAWLARMQRERYDLVVQLYGSGVYANPVALLLGGRCCAGYIRPDDTEIALDAALPLPADGAETDRALALICHLGAQPAGRGYDLRLTDADRVAADRFLRGLPQPVLGVHCGARDDDRRAEPEAFGQAARSARPGSLVLLGGAEERAHSGRLAAAAADLPCLDLVGAVPLATAAAVIAGLDALLTTDSAPAHLAYATRTPSVTVFLDSDPRRWGPPLPGPHMLVDHADGRAVDPAELAAAVRHVLDER